MADMTEQNLDDMRRHAEPLMQRRRERAPDIVHDPSRQRLAVDFGEPLVQRDFGVVPFREPLRSSVSEHLIASDAPWLYLDQRPHRRRHRDEMRAAVLGALWGEDDETGFQVDLGPAQA